MSKMIESSFPAVNRIHSGFHFDLLARIAHRSQRTGYTAWSYDVGGIVSMNRPGCVARDRDGPTVGAGIVGASAGLHQSAARSRSRLPEHTASSSSSESPLRCRL